MVLIIFKIKTKAKTYTVQRDPDSFGIHVQSGAERSREGKTRKNIS